MIKSFYLFLLYVAISVGCNYQSPRNSNENSKEKATIYSHDTLNILHAEKTPVIDGNNEDDIWENSVWLPIKQVWIPYGETIDSTIFCGRYKIAWSESTNLIYILAEITDNVFVGGHTYHPDPAIGKGYADYDIFEIFIDEDKSGGLHVFDADNSELQQWGSNAENAFAYHLTIETPKESEVIKGKRALDIAGKSWSDYFIADFQDHIPEFAVRKFGNQYTWELSLKIYNDSYDHDQPEKSRVTLTEEKIMGFSVAYCNNDDINEEPKKRDHFFGSVWVPEENYNDHWKDASFFGTIKLRK